MQDTIKVNRKHKDRLFRLLFGDERNKENLLSLYNAINNTEYSNAEELEITTIEDAIYMGMKNDVSLLISDNLSLYEHQSTYNENMPIRGFLYFGKLYDKYITTHELNLYSIKQIKLPTPQYIVFYNGEGMDEDVKKLKLSDSFKNKSGEFEWTATVVNINYGKNKELMDKCHKLKEYSIFVDKVKQYTKNQDINEAINRAVDECIKEGVLSDFLIGHKAEVINVCITEYDEEKVMTALKNEYIEIGMERGVEQTICNLVNDGLLSFEEAAKRLGTTIEDIKQKVQM